MRHILLLILLSFTVFVNAQTKPKSKKSTPTKPEIDKLYEKYKDSDSITLYTPHGELFGNVNIDMNENNKPISVQIYGHSENKSAIAEFISNTIKMKLKQGYKATKMPFGWGSWSFTELVEQGLENEFREGHSFQLLMKKGSMYFRVDAGCCQKSLEGDVLYNFDQSFRYSWEIETGDSKRKGGNKATDFEF
ncbi:MAG: hypothetical protein RLZZ175_973 [Bacteroidota bacterium]|jgi:hypothetical protein